jgi:hypothetical protein
MTYSYFGQYAGEQVGPGFPPSANDAVDNAKVTRTAATNKRVTFFILNFPLDQV